ncbi:hypothetical protein PFISCL1PPCAC_7518, partial [Pristionchus fissidentatus]
AKLPGDKMLLALHQPYYYFPREPGYDYYEVYDFEIEEPMRFCCRMSIAPDIAAFVLHKDHLYFLADKPDVGTSRLTHGPNAMVLVYLPDPKSAGTFGQDHLDFLYLLSKKTLLVIHAELILYEIDLQC